MLKRFSTTLFVLMIIGSSSAFAVQAKFRFASKAESSAFLATADEYTDHLTTLDRSARHKTSKNVSNKEHLKFLADQAIDWTDEEIKTLNDRVAILNKLLKTFDSEFKLPTEILLIRTTGLEEFGLPYTRRNAIIIPVIPEDGHLDVVFHEFFHIVSRYNPNLTNKLYAIAGFQPDASLKIPSAIAETIITNPDAFKYTHNIELNFNGMTYKAIPLIMFKIKQEEITSNFQLGTSWDFKILLTKKNQDPILVNILDTNFLEAIRYNRGSPIHPEEAMADNFALLVKKSLNPSTDVKHPEVLDELVQALRKN